MRSITYYALFAASMFSTINAQAASNVAETPIPTPTAQIALAAPLNQGCFTNADNLVDYGPGPFQTDGTCQQICGGLQKGVMGIWRGSNCFCGDKFPSLEYLDDSNSSCSSTCNGFDMKCGGPMAWTIWTTGLYTGDPGYAAAVVQSSSDATTATEAPATPSAPGATQTVILTETASSSSGPSKAGIAAGVVVGVVAIAGIIGGIVLLLKRRKRLAVEEEYQRNAAMKDFGKPPGTGHSSLTDTRLDPEIMMRRQSNGSIADNQDFSRRVLQIRNPDGL